MKRPRATRFVGTAIALCVPAVILAAVPHVFQSGTAVSSAKVNENFMALDQRIMALEGGLAATGKFEGFSATANNLAKASGWQELVVNQVEFDTFSPAAYSATTGLFTAPRTGYYQFSVGGYSPTEGAAPDERFAFGFSKNGLPSTPVISGGQLSDGDSPLPSMSHIMRLTAGDNVALRAFSPGPVTLGSATHLLWFQGRFVGN